jgi:hypothetical protein
MLPLHQSPVSFLERVAGIEPASSAWKAEVLPLNYTRIWRALVESNHHPEVRSLEFSPLN